MNFHSKWYFPANATLYLVGDFEEDVPALISAIEKMFGTVPPARDGDRLRLRHPFRPPVRHVYGLQPHAPPPPAGTGALPGGIMQGEGTVQLFQHALLQNFTVNIFCKLPVRRVTAMDQLRKTFMARLVLSVLQFRATRRYWKPDCPFVSLDLDHSDTGREGCFVTTLTVSAEPEKWCGQRAGFFCGRFSAAPTLQSSACPPPLSPRLFSCALCPPTPPAHASS